MGRAVYRQPDGLLCEWSTIVDDFVVYDMTPEQYVEHKAEEAAEEAREAARRTLEIVAERGTNSYSGDTLREKIDQREEHHGAERQKGDSKAQHRDYRAWITKMKEQA